MVLIMYHVLIQLLVITMINMIFSCLLCFMRLTASYLTRPQPDCQFQIWPGRI